MKVTTKFLFLTALGLSVVAGDHKINLMGRFDYVSADNDAKNSGISSYERFQTTNLYTSFSGKLDTDTTYSGRFNWKRSGADDSGINKAVEKFYIKQKFSPMVDVTFGKQGLTYGGAEQDYSSSDIYLGSTSFDNAQSYVMGMTVGTYMAGQSVYWQVFNSDSDGKTNNEQRRLTYGVAYIGNIMNGMIIPSASMHTRPTSDSDDGSGAVEKYLSVGSRFNFGNSYFEVDYNSFKGTKTKQDTTTLAFQDEEKTSFIANLGHVMGSNHFMLKFVTNDSELNGAEVYSEKGYSVVYEFKKSAMLRYHVAYLMEDRDYKATATKDTSVSKIIAGIKFDVDVL